MFGFESILYIFGLLFWYFLYVVNFSIVECIFISKLITFSKVFLLNAASHDYDKQMVITSVSTEKSSSQQTSAKTDLNVCKEDQQQHGQNHKQEAQQKHEPKVTKTSKDFTEPVKEEQSCIFDIIARMLFCCSLAVLSSIMSIILCLINASFDASMVDFTFFTYCFINIDTCINSFCLLLQWPFSTNLYNKLCGKCDSKVKKCFCLNQFV